MEGTVIAQQSTSGSQRRWSRPTPAIKRAVRLAYIQGEGSLSSCCLRHNISFQTARNWYELEGWKDLRASFDLKAKIATEESVKPAGLESPTNPQPAPSQNTKLDAVEKQLKKIDEELDKADVGDLPALWKAKSMALDAWALLTGFPRPGTRKAARNGRAWTPQEPISQPEPQSTPQPVVSQPQIVATQSPADHKTETPSA
jgi:transposase-like protein